MDKVAIVILNWNGEKMLRKYLPSVLEYSAEDGGVVYVADNASTDGSILMLKEQFPQVRVIQFDKNWGFAEGYNKALGQIDAELYVLLNSDVEVTHHWLTPLVEYMDNHYEVASPSSCRNKTRTPLNMPERQAAISTNTATPSAAGVSSTQWRMMTGNTITPRRCSGLRGHA